MSDKYPSISVLGLTLPITAWSISAFSMLAIVAVAALIYRQIVPPDLVSLKQANAQMAFTISEYGVHLTDTPEQRYADPDGTLTVQVYRDHCVSIQRRTVTTGIQTQLIPDPARGRPVAIAPYHGDLLPVVEAAGRCLNPHPGPFQTTYGEKHGCLVDVWRTWPDGCSHAQSLNLCTNSWDTNPDGSPRVRWRTCVH